MNKKRIILILRILILLTVVVSGGFAWYFWNLEYPMKAVLCGMGGAMIVFNFFIAIFLINRNIK
ncbi:MAG: hypothetical protein ACRCSQ_00425 [Bacteroidales bacterium]